MGLQKYVGRLQELHRLSRRHSAFWVGLYGHLWVGAFLVLALISAGFDPNQAP